MKVKAAIRYKTYLESFIALIFMINLFHIFLRFFLHIIQPRQGSNNRINTESYIFSHHKSTNSLSNGLGIKRLTNSKSISTMSPTMINSYSKLQNLRQVKKPNKSSMKLSTKNKIAAKRKTTKDKKGSKNYDSKLQLFFKIIYLQYNKFFKARDFKLYPEIHFQSLMRINPTTVHLRSTISKENLMS